jgi:hypothetical protein
MRNKFLVCAIAAAASLKAFANERGRPLHDLARLRSGMTKSEVIAVLGPTKRDAQAPCFDASVPGGCLGYDGSRYGFSIVLLSFRGGSDNPKLDGIFVIGTEEAKALLATSQSATTPGVARNDPPAKKLGAPTREAARQLDTGMTMDEVRALLGEPNSTSQQTCGGAPGVPTWPCRTWTYQSDDLGFMGLRVTFQRCGNTWCVNNWS